MEVIGYIIAVGIGYLLCAFWLGSQCGSYSQELITRLYESEREKQKLQEEIARLKTREARA